MLYQSCWNNLVTGLIVPSSLLQFVNSLFQTCSNKFGTSSANTSCQQLVNRLVTTCLQVCSNLCVFTCVIYTRKNLTTCNKSADKPSTRCVRTACTKFVNKLFQTCSQLVTSLTKISDLLQGCSNNSDTILL